MPRKSRFICVTCVRVTLSTYDSTYKALQIQSSTPIFTEPVSYVHGTLSVHEFDLYDFFLLPYLVLIAEFECMYEYEHCAELSLPPGPLYLHCRLVMASARSVLNVEASPATCVEP